MQTDASSVFISRDELLTAAQLNSTTTIRTAAIQHCYTDYEGSGLALSPPPPYSVGVGLDRRRQNEDDGE